MHQVSGWNILHIPFLFSSASAVGADGKDIAALRDELVELKKSLNSVTSERDLLHTKCAKLEQVLGKKDKKIKHLLASGHHTVSCEYYMWSFKKKLRSSWDFNPGLSIASRLLLGTGVENNSTTVCYS